MSSNDYVVQNIYRYTRKSYKKQGECSFNGCSEARRDDIEITDDSPRSERFLDTPGCSCDIEPESEIANILHKKCPVIALAQQQLHKLLGETDNMLSESSRYRTLGDLLYLFKRAIVSDRGRCVLFILIVVFFFIGLILGAASCGTYERKFNTPILTCLDNLFLNDYYPKVDTLVI